MVKDPRINTIIDINGEKYSFTEAPNAPGIIYAEVGRKAKVYRLINDERAYALKVFKPRYRSELIVENTRRITQYQDVPGLAVAKRIIITPEEYSHIIEENRSFAYAVLMPWIEGKSWFNYITGRIGLQRKESLILARALVNSVNELEKRDLAHCDLSSSNFIFTADYQQVELIDIEDLFGEGLEEPLEKPAGTGGYAPGWIRREGVWEAGADRFAAGILISEILGWQFSDVRAASAGETYFPEEEFGKKTQRYQILADRLGEIHPELTSLFKTLWYAESVEECPRVAEWKGVLEYIREPEMMVTPDILDFGVIDVLKAKTTGNQKMIEIINTGGGVLHGKIRCEVPWLSVDPCGFHCSEGKRSQHNLALILSESRDLKKGGHRTENALSIVSDVGDLEMVSEYQIVSARRKPPKWIFWLCVGLIGLLLVVMLNNLNLQPGLKIFQDGNNPWVLSTNLFGIFSAHNDAASNKSNALNPQTPLTTKTANFLVSKIEPTATFTQKPTSRKTIIIASPTIAPPIIVFDYLDDVVVMEFDAFDTSSGWHMHTGRIQNNVLEIKGRDWNAVSRKGTFSEGEGVVLDFMFEAQTVFEVLFQHGTWDTDPYRRLGMICDSGIPKTNLFLGKNALGFNNIHGNFRLSDNVWYTLLMVIDENGEFLALINDIDNPANYYRYHEKAGEKWSGYSWDLSIGANTGTVYINNFYKINFSGIK